MQVQVETYVDEGGAERIRRFYLGSRVIEVVDNIDQWHGADYRYVKVRSCDGDVYILRHNETGDEWELTMYQRSQSVPDSCNEGPRANSEGQQAR